MRADNNNSLLGMKYLGIKIIIIPHLLLIFFFVFNPWMYTTRGIITNKKKNNEYLYSAIWSWNTEDVLINLRKVRLNHRPINAILFFSAVCCFFSFFPLCLAINTTAICFTYFFVFF